MFDWSNSVYNLVITSTIFPAYYTAVTADGGEGLVSFFGFEIVNTVLYSYALSFSYLLIALISPLLSGVADYSGKKKQFLQLFTYLGAFSCCMLYFFNGSNVEWGIIFAVLASIGFTGGLVFYNAFLPEITTPDRYDVISAKGYALGYAGSMILLAVNLFLISSPELVGLPGKGLATRLAFPMVGIWWVGFAQIPFKWLPNNPFNRKPSTRQLAKGYEELRRVWQSVPLYPNVKKFLAAFFFFSMGVQTVVLMAAAFGTKVLGLPGNTLIGAILVIQVLGIAGSYFFAWISKLKGNIFSLTAMIIIWITVCIMAYFITSTLQFYLIAALVGLVMGGIQALSRATYSKLIPGNTADHASWFSFYDVAEKLSVVMGTFAFGFIEQITTNMRNSTLILALFFIIGLVLIRFVKMPAKIQTKPTFT